MKKRLTKFAQVAGIMLALAFTFSCSGSDDNNNGCVVGSGSTFKDDRDGKSYKSVKIGEQTWMAENLNYRGSEPDTLGSCYDNNPANCTTYGRLYGRTEAKEAACPSGWHLPDTTEWNTLIKTVGGSSTAGTKLKSKCGWNDYEGTSGNGTDDFGFFALPSGYYMDGRFRKIGETTYWWSSSNYGGNNVTSYLGIHYKYGSSEWGASTGLLSVRCIQGN